VAQSVPAAISSTAGSFAAGWLASAGAIVFGVGLAAAKVLASLLGTLRSASPQGRRGGLAIMRMMIEKGGA
jgi:hypothetical protein